MLEGRKTMNHITLLTPAVYSVLIATALSRNQDMTHRLFALGLRIEINISVNCRRRGMGIGSDMCQLVKLPAIPSRT